VTGKGRAAQRFLNGDAECDAGQHGNLYAGGFVESEICATIWSEPVASAARTSYQGCPLRSSALTLSPCLSSLSNTAFWMMSSPVPPVSWVVNDELLRDGVTSLSPGR